MASAIPRFDPADSDVPTVVLNDGHPMPQLGFGVYKVEEEQTEPVVGEALRTGYRAIDTASVYGNEEGVGAAIAASGIPREQLFITTKVWNDQQGHDATLRAFEESRAKLGLEYLDLYLIHWPVPKQDRFVETFRAMQQLKADGLVRSIGVSNFRIEDLEKLIDATGEVPVVNQVELHPGFAQEELRAYHAGKGIATEAWSPLGRGRLLDDPTIGAIARTHGRTPAQVIIRWHLQLGIIAIPKSVTPVRIRSNFDVFGFQLDDQEVADISAIRTEQGRYGADPAEFGA